MSIEIGGKWNEWTVETLLGEGSFGKVCRIYREEFGNRFESALKVIRIPQSEQEVINARNDGMDEQSLRRYFFSMVKGISNECAIMYKMRGVSNIVSYEEHSIVELEDAFGWEIYIRMELLKPLVQYMKEHDFTEQDVISLGIDVCKGLEACAKQNIIHRDIKPENVFVTDSGMFKLGDFGIARQLGETRGMSQKGTPNYMAPEILKGEPYSANVDIYSLGIMMYRLMNNNRTPFLPAYPQPVTFKDREEAFAKKLRGEELPPPSGAGAEFTEIIMKACAYDPAERYSTAEELHADLDKLRKKSGYAAPAHDRSHRKINKKIAAVIAAVLIAGASVTLFLIQPKGSHKWVSTMIETFDLLNDENDSANINRIYREQNNLDYANTEIMFPEYTGETVTVKNANELISAVQDAETGTTIILEPGTYDINDILTVEKSQIKLVGTGDSKPHLNTTIRIIGNNVMLENLEVETSDSILEGFGKNYSYAAIRIEETPFDGDSCWCYLKDVTAIYNSDLGANTIGLATEDKTIMENCEVTVTNSQGDEVPEAVAIAVSFSKFFRAEKCEFNSSALSYDIVASMDDSITDELIEYFEKNNTFNAPDGGNVSW